MNARPIGTIAIVLAALAVAPSARAENCTEKFVRLLINGNPDTPVVIGVVQTVNGGTPSKSTFSQLKLGHWMTATIEPANMQWTLGYNNSMFTSADKGKTWKKIRDMDSAKNKENGEQNRRENAKTVRDATCGDEVLDGVKHETVEATYDLRVFRHSCLKRHWI